MSTEQLEKKDTQENPTLVDQKMELAELYLHTLDSKREDILGTASTMGIKLNPFREKAIKYLLKQKGSLISQIGDNFKYAAIKAATNKANLDLEYDIKKLQPLQKLFEQVQTTDQLTVLKKQIDEGKDISKITLTDSSEDTSKKDLTTQESAVDPSVNASASSSIDSLSSSPNRSKVLTKLDDILDYDAKHPIKYTWGGRAKVDQGLDCSGLLIYTMQQAGFKAPGGDSRDIFTHIPTQKVDSTNTQSSLSNIQPGDAIFWNSTNPRYRWSSGSIPKLEKDGNKYRIHHIAFVKEISSDGKITIVESSGSKGVSERVVDPTHELLDTKHKSELYVGQIDYDKLLAYQAKPDEDLLATA